EVPHGNKITGNKMCAQLAYAVIRGGLQRAIAIAKQYADYTVDIGHGNVGFAIAIEIRDYAAKRSATGAVVKHARSSRQEHLDLSVIETGHHVGNSVTIQVTHAGKIRVSGRHWEADKWLEAAIAIVVDDAQAAHA